MSKCHTHYTGMAEDFHAFAEVWTLRDLYKNIFVMKLGDTHPLIHKKVDFVCLCVCHYLPVFPNNSRRVYPVNPAFSIKETQACDNPISSWFFASVWACDSTYA